jgi:arylsulfatase A-like enzyme
MRIRILLTLVFLSGATIGPAATTESKNASDGTSLDKRRNIVLIISDDHRWDCLGAAGNSHVKTPNLDQLAKDGVHFIQATVATPQCAPSRAALLTGLPGHQNGYFSNQTQLKERANSNGYHNLDTMPGKLSSTGYSTVLVGKWHLKPDPWNCGFNTVRQWLGQGAGSYKNLAMSYGNNRETTTVQGFTQEVLGKDAAEFITSEEAKEKPFLLWLALTAPHSPLKPNPHSIEGLYAGKSNAELAPPGFTVGEEDERLSSFTKAMKNNAKARKRAKPANQAQRPLGEKNVWRDYYGAITSVDEQVGRVREALKKSGLERNTIIIFMGDNGLMRGSRGWQGKVLPYDESVRIPMIVHAPGLATINGTSSATVSTLDLPPSIARWAGADVPEQWAGRDLTAALKSKSPNEFRTSFAEFADNVNRKFGNIEYRLVRSPEAKLIRWKDPAKGDEFFDLVKDPRELTNEIANSKYREQIKAMEKDLAHWQTKTNDETKETGAEVVTGQDDDE